ncbi:MAG: hypothetical protein LAC69_00095 [Chlorobium sp.]|jgi:hypothetical protein|nr:hypothetical protein [Chlorobium sp.]
MMTRKYNTRRPIALLMTATLTPPSGTPELARNDAKLRLLDYCEALRFYLTLPDDILEKIIFIDNSDSDLSALEAVGSEVPHKKKVELIKFQGNDHPPEFGKGYGEFKLIDYGITHSTLLSPEDLVWKVTGRLRVLNLSQLIDTAPLDYNLYCDLRHVPMLGDQFGANEWMDLRVFSWSNIGYEHYIRDRFELLKTELIGSPERYFFKLLKAAKKSAGIVPRFRIQPNIAGFGGRLNVNYQNNSYRYKNGLRRVGRLVAPWIWL